MTGPTTAPHPTMVELVAQPTVTVRVQQAMAELDLAAVFDREPGRILERLHAEGSAAIGPLFARYHTFGPDIVDVETGFPVAGAPPGIPPLADAGPGGIGVSALPDGQAAVSVHIGPYYGLSAAYDGLRAWIDDQGRTPGSAPWEAYLDQPAPGTDPATLRTEIIWPLKD